ncbi:MAG TPA: bifunctional diaminohydroxyphosphoribosylaminopyrimidine deaminase/5-amino-6-(5-phosphoribosylamino)uracil reductase RibD [Acidobacteriaceae bacterium]|nr:bifunctional diaminohydroxyphosphoribosylaminopyrimidine deaminase/5-amino-6-(5-phosphoribosylamino)uracil reductase RibD [Acidobacteriaceae bacterium]
MELLSLNPRVENETDERWMRRALALAGQSVGLASPNPVVGCVLVRDDQIIGEGFHAYDQRDHAEIVALKAAGPAAKGSTAYTTLEPCSHCGRTGPCADALIQAGVARVVAATTDPNPAVNGCGLERLRAAGITVETGVLCDEARELNDTFARYIQTRLPLLTLKAGISLDGRIAPAPGFRTARRAVMLTGPESQAEVQRMRHASDALITGIGTVLADNPLLTDRSGLPRRRPLLRVVLDSNLRLPLDSRLVQTAAADVLVFCVNPDAERRRALESAGIRIEQLGPEPDTNRVPLQRVIQRLGELEITSAMLEGGAKLNATALNGYADKLTLFYAPIFLGPAAVPFVEASETIKIQPIRTRQRIFGRDRQLETWLRDPWATNAPALTADR